MKRKGLSLSAIKNYKHLALLILIMVSLMTSCKSVKNMGENNALAKHVILVGSDGFGAYAFEKARIPHLRKMMREGSYSLQARSVLPSSSAVNWASMIMGSGPELHGYTEWGSKTPEVPSRVIGETGIYPSIFNLLEKQKPEAKKGVSYTWGGIGYLFEKQWVDLDFNGQDDGQTLKKALEFIVEEKPALTFIHFDEPDVTGHEIGHDTPEYYQAVEKVDSLVGELLTTLEENGLMEDTVILFTADHGGIGKGHGGKNLLEMEIPWIIFGKNIAGKGKLGSSIVTYDTATTIALLLGLDTPDFWRGKPVIEALKTELK